MRSTLEAKRNQRVVQMVETEADLHRDCLLTGVLAR